MRYIDHGEEVLITRRNKVIAKIIPMAQDVANVTLPDFAKRARSIIRVPKGKSPSSIVLEDRKERV